MRPITKFNQNILRFNTTKRKNSKFMLRTSLRKLKNAQLCQSFNRQITRMLNMKSLSQSTRSVSNFINNTLRLLLNTKMKNPLKHIMSQMKSSTLNLKSCMEHSTISISEDWILTICILRYCRLVLKQSCLKKPNKKLFPIMRWKWLLKLSLFLPHLNPHLPVDKSRRKIPITRL